MLAGFTHHSHDIDLVLSRDASAGDPRARSMIAERIVDRARRTVFYLSGGDSEWEDDAQAAMIEVLRAVGSFRGESTLENWAERIVVRTAMRRINKRRRRRGILALVADEDARPARGGEEELGRQRMARRMARLFRDLPPEQHVALVLRMVYGYGVEEIAEITEARPNTVRNRLRVGRQKLRLAIREDPLYQEWIRENIR